ncbi:MAG: hypothetical protein AAGI53_11895 [Planctomycetota bacterium]
MNHTLHAPVNPARQPKPANEREHRRPSPIVTLPTVDTTDFSRRPFGRCGLLPPQPANERPLAAS